MENESIDIEVQTDLIQLNDISFHKKDSDQKFYRENKIDFMNFNEENGNLEIMLTEKLYGFIEAELKIFGRFFIVNLGEDKKLPEQFVKDIKGDESLLNDIAYPLLAEGSHLISFLTSKVQKAPIVVPPAMTSLLYKEEE